MDPVLAWLEFPSEERVFLTATCSLGRAPENRVVIPIDGVSRRHAVLRLGDDLRWTLVDMGSSNGTYLNGQRIPQPVPLSDGNIIEIASQKITFRMPALAEAPALVEATEKVPCWLLSFTGIVLGAPEPSQCLEAKTFENWSERCQRIVKKYRGGIMRAMDDGFLAFWPVQSADSRASTVASALRSLRAVQSTAAEFRFALHYGTVDLHATAAGEAIPRGPAVIHAMQLDKLARAFERLLLITGPAKEQLGEEFPAHPLVGNELRGYRGSLQFFTVEG